MPNRSKASRSNQLAPLQTSVSGGDLRHVVVDAERFQAQAPVVRERKQVRDDAVARAFPRHVAVAGIVDAAQIDELLEADVGVIPQDSCRFEVIGRGDGERDLAERALQRLHAGAQLCLDGVLQSVEWRRHRSGIGSSERSCSHAGSSPAAAARRTAALRLWAGSRARRRRPARCGRSRAPRSSCSGSSRRRWRNCPSR